MRADRKRTRRDELQRCRRFRGIRYELRQAQVDDALTEALLYMIAAADLDSGYTRRGVDVAENPPAVTQLGNERDIHAEMRAQRAQRAGEELVERNGLRRLVLDEKIQHQDFVGCS